MHSSRRSVSVAVVALLVVSTALTGCQVVRSGAKCRVGAAPGRDATHVLMCQGGRWRRVMTIGQAANFITSTWPRNVEAVWGGEQTTPILQPFGGLRVRVTRTNGQPAAGADVTFSAPGSIATGTVRTNEDGVADFVPVATQTAGKFTITATASGGFAPTATFAVESYATGPAVGVVAAAGTPQSAPAGNNAFATPIQVKAVDQYGNGVGGQQVDLTSSGSIWFAPASAWTGEGGIGATTAYSGNVARTETVTATLVANGATAQFPLTVVAGPPQNFGRGSGDGERTLINTPFANGIVMAMSDAFGNPVAGIPVTFAVQPAGSGAAATLDSTTVVTDANGLAIGRATANGIRGSYTVTATYGATTLSYTLFND